MKFINASVEICPQEEGIEGIYKQIERAGRVSYKSEDKITEDSAKGFVDRLISNKHGAVLEFGTVYLKMEWNTTKVDECVASIKYYKNPFSKVRYVLTKRNHLIAYITTNYRVLVENEWLDDLKYLCEPTKNHYLRVCTKWVCSRGISHELVRHRSMSFIQESQRFCNYSKGKFCSEITYIIPSHLESQEEGDKVVSTEVLTNALKAAEDSYLTLIEQGWKPQQARDVLPNATKTELYVCGFIDDWKHFFELRCAPNAHPDMQVLAKDLQQKFSVNKLI